MGCEDKPTFCFLVLIDYPFNSAAITSRLLEEICPEIIQVRGSRIEGLPTPTAAVEKPSYQLLGPTTGSALRK
jgi:hypothetical protein